MAFGTGSFVRRLDKFLPNPRSVGPFVLTGGSDPDLGIPILDFVIDPSVQRAEIAAFACDVLPTNGFQWMLFSLCRNGLALPDYHRIQISPGALNLPYSSSQVLYGGDRIQVFVINISAISAFAATTRVVVECYTTPGGPS